MMDFNFFPNWRLMISIEVGLSLPARDETFTQFRSIAKRATAL